MKKTNLTYCHLSGQQIHRHSFPLSLPAKGEQSADEVGPAGPLRPRSAPAPATPAATAVQTAQTGLQTPGRDVSPGPARPRPTPHLPTQMETGAGPDRLPGDATGSFSAVGRPP